MGKKTVKKEKFSPPGALYLADVSVPKPVKVKFIRFVSSKDQKFEELSKKTKKISIEPDSLNGSSSEKDLPVWEQSCLLCRYDKDNKLVWRTHHGSVREALWQAEFEFDLSFSNWKTSAPGKSTKSKSKQSGRLKKKEEKIPNAEDVAKLPRPLTSIETIE